MQDICFLPATQLRQRYDDGDLGAVEVTRAVLEQIGRLNPALNAFYHVCDDALEQAAISQSRIDQGRPGALEGVPVSLKDHVLVDGLPTPYGSLASAGNVAKEDSIVWERLRSAGAVLIGKTIMPTFGHMGVTHSYLHGITRNPWNLDYSPGGSSGGGAAAVAAGMGPLTIGTDGGGSIRIPSSFSGIFGFKPSFGRVPLYPVVGGSEQLSHAGPMTRTVADAALMLSVIAGPDERDNLSLPGPTVDYLEGLEDLEPSQTRIAYAPQLGYADVDDQVASAVRQAIDALADAGCIIDEVGQIWDDPTEDFMTLFCTNYALRSGSQLASQRHLLEDSFVRMVERGLTIGKEEFIAAGARRREMVQRGRELFSRYDVLMLPTVTVPPIPVGMDAPPMPAASEFGLESWCTHTFTFNMTGYPAATLPCGFAEGKLPIGLQVVGPRFADRTVLNYSRLVERVIPWANLIPPIATD